jgi:hypothetical protein
LEGAWSRLGGLKAVRSWRAWSLGVALESLGGLGDLETWNAVVGIRTLPFRTTAYLLAARPLQFFIETPPAHLLKKMFIVIIRRFLNTI